MCVCVCVCGIVSIGWPSSFPWYGQVPVASRMPIMHEIVGTERRGVGVGRAGSRVAECWPCQARKELSIDSCPLTSVVLDDASWTGLDANAQCEMRPPSGPDAWISQGRKRVVASANASPVRGDTILSLPRAPVTSGSLFLGQVRIHCFSSMRFCPGKMRRVGTG